MAPVTSLNDSSFVPRMIATDIDGTMLRPDGTLSPRVRQALHDAADAGIEVVPATGRPELVAADVKEALGLGGRWVFANGAVTKDLTADQTVRGYWMDPDVASALVDQLRPALADAVFGVEMEHGMAYEAGFEVLSSFLPRVPPVDDIQQALVDGVGGSRRLQKLVVAEPAMTLDELFVVVSETLGERGVASYSGLPFIEVAADQVTKATALDALCTDLGIDPADVAAFGDNHNDVTMLEWAGWGYAMANGSDDAKDAAELIIRNNTEDGLARKIEQFLARL